MRHLCNDCAAVPGKGHTGPFVQDALTVLTPRCMMCDCGVTARASW